MRIRFFQASDEQETAALLSLHTAIDEFWRQFSKAASGPPQRWMGRLRTELSRIDVGIGLEAEVCAGAERRLYVLPVGGAQYHPLAEAVVARAPTVWPWTISTRREPQSLAAALARVRADVGMDLTSARARVGIARGHGLEVVLASHLFHGSSDEAALNAAELFVATLLGDELFERWVLAVDVATAPRPGPLRVVGQEEGSLPLALHEVQEAAFNAVRRTLQGLPEHPCHLVCEHSDWVLFEVGEVRSAEQAEELPMSDLRVATTMCPEMLKCFLSAIPFASQRFSAHGESYCYLQLVIDGTEEERLQTRIACEEELDHALVPGRLGCVVGAGVGLQYMYIVLALQALDPAVRLIIRRLGKIGTVREAWLRFCDDEWQREWVGLRDDTPSPL